MKKTETPRQPLPDCSVCERVLWGEYVYLGFGQYRHQECAPGSASWRERYAKHPGAHSKAGDFLFHHQPTRRV